MWKNGKGKAEGEEKEERGGGERRKDKTELGKGVGCSKN